MINFNTIPNRGITKTGLGVTFENLSSSKIKMNIDAGTITIPGIANPIVLAATPLEIDCVVNTDVILQWLLVRKSDGTYDHVVTERTKFARGAPFIPAFGYTLVLLMGEGKNPAGNQVAGNVDFLINSWV